MRVLFIAPYVPSATRLRSYQITRTLARLGHEVTVVALGTDDPALDAKAEHALSKFCLSVHVVPHSKYASLWQSALHVTSSVPVWAAACFSSKLEFALSEVANTANFDVAHVEHLRAARAGLSIKHRLPVVFDAVDCMTDIEESIHGSTTYAQAESGVPWQEHAKLSRYEPKCAAGFDRVVISSDHGATRLSTLAAEQKLNIPLEIIPNGVDLNYFSLRSHPKPVPGTITMVGDTAHAEIREALLYFCREIFPAVRQAYPSATFTLAGPDRFRDLASLAAEPVNRINVTGLVPDIRPFVAQSSVVVWPIQAGMRAPDAILQTLAMGRAIVASPEACRPLATSPPRESLCVADTPLSFVTQIVHLLQHPEEVTRLGIAARDYAEQHHNWTDNIQRLIEIYSEAIESRGGSKEEDPEQSIAA